MTEEEKRELIEKLSRETAILCRLQKQITDQLREVLKDVQSLRNEVGLNEGRSQS